MTSMVLSSRLGRWGKLDSLYGHAAIAIPAVLLAAVAIPFRYDVTLAEPDLVRMMAALVYGSTTGAEEAAGMHYGLKFSFGYYQLLYTIAPDAWLRDPDLASRLINVVGTVAGLLCAWTCTLYLGRLFGLATSVAAAVMFFLSPAMLAVSLSGHPLFLAAACLFGGGHLLLGAEEDSKTMRKWILLAASCGVLAFGLTVRAEIVLAFPFVWLATTKPRLDWRSWWPIHGARTLILTIAFAVFLALQRDYVAESGGAAGTVSSFLESFVSIGRLNRGLVVLALATGIVTMLAGFLSVLRRPWPWPRMYLPLALALPALVLWLPNPQPARHFFFASLGICLLVALRLASWQKKPIRAVTAAMLIAVLNQFAAESVHPVIASGYAWSYPPASDRRATQQVPIGAFPFDQRANQAIGRAERNEAQILAKQLPERLLVFADFQHYLIAHFIAADTRLHWSEVEADGVLVASLKSPAREIVLVQKYGAWPRDVTAEVLEDARWNGWPVYVQPSTVSRFDRLTTPTARIYRPLAPVTKP